MKQRTYVFKPKFEKKLKRLGIKGKFIRNIREQAGEDWIDWCKDSNTDTSWKCFVSGAFTWENTPEKDVFWLNIYSK